MVDLSEVFKTGTLVIGLLDLNSRTFLGYMNGLTALRSLPAIISYRDCGSW